jgi:Ca2+-binding RTX toxin-like protein
MTLRYTPSFVLTFLTIAFLWLPVHGQVSSSFSNGVLTVNSGAVGDVITISALAGSVKVNGNDPDSGLLLATSVTRIIVNGNGGDDAIDITGVSPLVYTNLVSTVLSGGDDSDEIFGSIEPDSMFGGAGNDTFFGNGGGDDAYGGIGDDVFAAQSDGDSLFGGPGNDSVNVLFNPSLDLVFEGDEGWDRVYVRGDPAAAENFLIEPLGSRVRVRNLPTPAYNAQIGSTEKLIVDVKGGNDVISADVGLASLISLQLLGGPGDDTIIGGDGNDLIVDQVGMNTLFGDGGHDTLVVGGLGSPSIVEGGAGMDSVQVDFAGIVSVVVDTSGGKLLVGSQPVTIGTTEKIGIDLSGGNDQSGMFVCGVTAYPAAVTVDGGSDFDVMTMAGSTASDSVEVQAVGDDALVNCNEGPGSVRVANFEVFNLSLDAGDDMALVQAVKTIPLSIDGGANASMASKVMAGDELVIDAQGKDAVDVGGQILVTGSQPINYFNFESVSFINSLPVELVAFNGFADGHDVHLRWNTASETNNAGFEVEMAAVAADEPMPLWESVGFVEGKGTTSEEQAYSTVIRDLDVGTHRFRLRQVDFDGAFEYSPEVEVTITLDGPFALSPAYPNPVGQASAANFSLAVAQQQRVRVVLFDALGREVDVLFDEEMTAEEEHRLRIPTNELAPGHYFYRASSDRFEATRSLIVR